MLDAAKAMKLSAKDLIELKIIDEIIPEPLGGAHRDRNLMLDNIRNSISTNLEYFKDISSDEIMNQRKDKFLKIGRNKGFIVNSEGLSISSIKNNNYDLNLKSKFFLISLIAVSLILLVSVLNLL